MEIKTAGTQKESKPVDVTQLKKTPILHYELDYDTLNPEQTIREFNAKIKSMIVKYEQNKDRIVEIEDELLDIYHYIEMTSYKKVPDGYKIYRKMADLRIERRKCKNENDLLWPIYSHFHATEVLNKLALVQGECGKVKSSIDNRSYICRTNVVEELMSKPKPEPVNEEDEEPIELIDVTIPDPLPEEEDIQPMDNIRDLKPVSGDLSKRPMSAFKQVWKVN